MTRMSISKSEYRYRISIPVLQSIMEVVMKIFAVIAFLIASLGLASWSTAGDFDGSKPLLVSVSRILECTQVEGCRDVSAESVRLPRFLKIDFVEKTIRPAKDGEGIPDTAIERSELVDGKMILQGAEDGYTGMRDGLGWTVAISEDSGQVVLTASGDQVAFVVFGASIPF